MDIQERLEHLRGELRAERISYGELAELQSLTPHIDPSDVELLEAAGVPENPPSEWPFGTTPEGVIRERVAEWQAAWERGADIGPHGSSLINVNTDPDDLLTVLGMLALGGSRGALVCNLIEREGAEDARRLRIEILAALGVTEG